MYKKLLVAFSLLFLASCNRDTLDQAKKLSQLNLVLSSVSLEAESDFSFNVALERPDVGKSQVDYKDSMSMHLSGMNLPDSLNPKLMYVSLPEDTDPQSGTMCYRSAFPHECSVTLDPDHAETQTYLVKVLFEDGTYASQEINVPIPQPLKVPEIIWPNQLPDSGSGFKLEFEDVGADRYEVSVMLCHEYENDGINPCLDSDTYLIYKQDEKWLMDESYKSNNPVFEVVDGVVEISSDFSMRLDASIDYEIYATKNDFAKTADGQKIPSLVGVWNYVSFE